MKRRRRGGGPFVGRLLVAAVLLAAPAWRARAAESVDSIVAHGVELRRQGKDAEALAEFQRALKIESSPRVQAQAGLAEQALGLWSAAEADLGAALARENEGDPWIKKNRATLMRALSVIQSHLGTLEIWGTPAGAEVSVNDKPVGTLPLKKAVRIAGDAILLSARAEGYLDSSRTVRVPPGETVREHVELIRAPTPRKADAVATSGGAGGGAGGGDAGGASPGGSGGGAAGDHGSHGSDDGGAGSPSRARLRPWAWGLGAGALAALGFGVFETLQRSKFKRDFDDYALPNPSDPSNPTRNYCNLEQLPPECRGFKDDFDRSQTLMIVGYAAAGALAVGSAVLFVLSAPSASSSDGSGEGSQQARLVCVPDLASPGVGCRFQF